MTTGTTFKEAPMTSGGSIMTPTTLLTGVVGSDIYDSHPFQGSFVLQKQLQFPKCPLVYPSIITGRLPDIGQVLHHQHVPLGQWLYDSFGNVVV